MTDMNDTTTTNTEAVSAPENVKYDDKVIKKIIASALLEVEGFLGTANGLISGITNILQKNITPEDDAMRGISADLKDGQVDVTVKIVTESGKNIPAIADGITTSITNALRDVGGLHTKAVHVEVVDTMTRAEYEEKNTKTQPKKEKEDTEA